MSAHIKPHLLKENTVCEDLQYEVRNIPIGACGWHKREATSLKHDRHHMLSNGWLNKYE